LGDVLYFVVNMCILRFLLLYDFICLICLLQFPILLCFYDFVLPCWRNKR